MISTSIVKFKGGDVEVRELTVEQIDQVMGNKSPLTAIDRIFNPDMVSETMLQLSTGLSSEELRSSSPSGLRPLVEAVKEVNSDFLAGLKSLL